jgi:23S rRNA pseudouridine2457 synthase
LEPLRRGITLKGERLKPAEAAVIPDPGLPPRIKPVRAYHPITWLRITVREGRKRQVRRMTAAVGLPCLRLIRVAIGSLELGSLAPGRWRWLTGDEQRELLRSVGLGRRKPGGRPG